MPIDVASYLKFTPTDNTSSFAADAEGHVYYDDSESKLKHYDGSDWGKVSVAGSGFPVLTSPGNFWNPCGFPSTLTNGIPEWTLTNAVADGGAVHIGSYWKQNQGKYYYEVCMINVTDRGSMVLFSEHGNMNTGSSGEALGPSAHGRRFANFNGLTDSALGVSWSNGDHRDKCPFVIGYWIDLDNNNIYWTTDAEGAAYTNKVGDATYAIPATHGSVVPGTGNGGGTQEHKIRFNFGQDPTFGGAVDRGEDYSIGKAYFHFNPHVSMSTDYTHWSADR